MSTKLSKIQHKIQIEVYQKALKILSENRLNEEFVRKNHELIYMRWALAAGEIRALSPQ